MKNIIIAGLAAALLAGCNATQSGEAAASAQRQVLETFVPARQLLTTGLRLPAELSGFRQVDVYAKVSSYVKELRADIGTKVKQGELLLVLEAPELASQRIAAESRLRSLEATFMASASTYNRLLETSKVEGTVSKNDLDLALAKKNSDEAQLQAGKASFNEISTMLGYLEIRAPFDGVVTARNVNTGAYVGPAGRGSESPLLVIQQQSKLRLSVYVPELYSGYLHEGKEATFQVKALPGKTFATSVSRMSGALDARLRSERVEMDVDNPLGELLPGMIAEVLLPLTPRDSAWVIPVSALVTSAEGVYVLAADSNKTRRVPVVKGREVNGKAEVFGSVKPGMELVTYASEEIRDGTPVK